MSRGQGAAGRRPDRASRVVALAALLAALAGCEFYDKVAGGSSEVDNPIVVAFTSATGQTLEVTGSLSVYLSDQNPSVDPDPILRKQLAGAASVRLTGADFTQGVHLDSARVYNLLLLGADSSAALLREVRFDPRTGRYTTSAGGVTSVKLAPSPLVRYASTLAGIDGGVVRVYVPGTPFQTVLVDSQFVFDAVPAGELPFNLMLNGAEVPLKRDTTSHGPRHHIDSSKSPRHPGPPVADSLRAMAGPDIFLYMPPEASPLSFSLNGDVLGVNPADARLAVLWKQIQDPAPRVSLTNRTQRNPRATFTQAGAYRFAFSASFGAMKSEDTVRVTVLPAPDSTVFSAPASGFVLYLNEPFQVAWYGAGNDTLTLQVAVDSQGVNWQNVPGQFPSRVGMNQRGWTPQGEPAAAARLRLVNRLGTVATSQKFSLAHRPPPPPAK